jgi:hypothetical protein
MGGGCGPDDIEWVERFIIHTIASIRRPVVLVKRWKCQIVAMVKWVLFPAADPVDDSRVSLKEQKYIH